MYSTLQFVIYVDRGGSGLPSSFRLIPTLYMCFCIVFLIFVLAMQEVTTPVRFFPFCRDFWRSSWWRSWYRAVQERLNRSRCRLGGWLGLSQGTTFRWRSRSPKGNGQFYGLSGPLKNIVSHCGGVLSKSIDNDVSTTAAADCIALVWPMSH